jgi:poly(A) polymerase
MYRTYVQVIAAASTAEGIKDWSGMVESRIRTLVQDLELTENVTLAHPHPGGVSNVWICLNDEEQAKASQGELSLEAMQRKEEDFAGQEYEKVYTKSFFIGLDIEKKPSKSRTVYVCVSLANTEKMRRTVFSACTTPAHGSAPDARHGRSMTIRR